MACISYNKLWESEFDGIVSKRDKLQDAKNSQIKLKVNEAYIKDEKITTNFEAVNNEGVINKVYFDKNLLKINGQLSKLKKDFNEFKLQYNEHSVEDVLVQRVVKITIQISFDKGFFDNYANADKVLEDFLFVTRRRGDLEDVNDNVQ